jgi:hypothetical protein
MVLHILTIISTALHICATSHGLGAVYDERNASWRREVEKVFAEV